MTKKANEYIRCYDLRLSYFLLLFSEILFYLISVMKTFLSYLKVLFFWVFMGGGLVVGVFVRFQRQKKIAIETMQQTIVTKLEALGNLETARMTLTKTIKWQQELTDYLPGIKRENAIQNFLFKDELTIEIEGTITAWFDLTKLTANNIIVNEDGTISISLPEPQILSKTLTENTKPIQRKTWILTKWDIELESQIRNKAINDIANEAIDQWILSQARNNAVDIIIHLLSTAGVQIKSVSDIWQISTWSKPLQ